MRSRRASGALAARCGIGAALLLSLATLAHAHGPPRGRGLIVDGDLIIVNIERGLVISTDGGQRWDLHCGMAIGVNSSEQAPMRLLSDKRLMLATSRGVQHSSLDYCDFTVLDSPDATTLVMAAHPTEPLTSLVSTTSEPLQGLYRTGDEGTSFERIGELPEFAFLANGMAYAPSDGTRVYAPANGANSDQTGVAYFMAVSSDGGATFAFNEVAIDADQAGLNLLGVHPTDAQTVMLRRIGRELMREDELLISNDGGQSFSVRMQAEAILALAVKPDGSRMLVGNAEGLFRSDDGGQSFEQVVAERSVSCLHYEGERLWVCLEPIDAIGFAGLSRSDDDGDTLEPVMVFDEVDEPPACAAGTAVAESCDVTWEDWYRELVMPPTQDGGTNGGTDAGADDDAGAPPRPDAATGQDAGASGSGDDGSGGCGCSVPGTRGGHASALLIAMALLASARFLRRRRR